MYGKTLFLVTGASRGFGRAIVEQLCKDIVPLTDHNSQFVLLARNVAGLEETKSVCVQKYSSLLQHVRFTMQAVDLSIPEETQSKVEQLLCALDRDFQTVFLFNNAGVLGDSSKTITQYDDLADIQKVYNVNVVSAIVLISTFCRTFLRSQRIVVQISTLHGIQAGENLALYCSSKAAMEMFIKTLALESPEIHTLIYAPGPLATDMLKELGENTGSKKRKEWYDSLIGSDAIINPLASAQKLMQLLLSSNFKSGDHVDFYDIK